MICDASESSEGGSAFICILVGGSLQPSIDMLPAKGTITCVLTFASLFIPVEPLLSVAGKFGIQHSLIPALDFGACTFGSRTIVFVVVSFGTIGAVS